MPASLASNFFELEDEEKVAVATALAEALKVSKVKSVKYVTCNKLLDVRSSHCMGPYMDPGSTSKPGPMLDSRMASVPAPSCLASHSLQANSLKAEGGKAIAAALASPGCKVESIK